MQSEASAPLTHPLPSSTIQSAIALQNSLVSSEKDASSSAQQQNSSDHSNESVDRDDEENVKKKRKRKKVNHACLYCRRSHMTCDEGRPCQRCLKREIGHLCHDEAKIPSSSKAVEKQNVASEVTPPAPIISPENEPVNGYTQTNPPALSMPTPQPAGGQAWSMPYFFQTDNIGNEFSVLTDFLESLEDPTLFNAQFSNTVSVPGPPLLPQRENRQEAPQLINNNALPTPESVNASNDRVQDRSHGTPVTPILPAATKTERFLLTAADQESGSRDERLRQVIQAKYEAGLLKPYNYVKGYARLSRWMDRNVSQDSKQQILQPLSVLRPKFRAVAQSLTDIDLVFIEEAFERLLLDYDRVFSAMGIPACLWRRTGEIYKGNREFAELVALDDYMLRDGRLCIYELMSEESAVNYWEKYGHVAFDSTQKAVLTSCVLRYKPTLTSGSSGYATPMTYRGNRRLHQPASQNDGGFVNCCFSFTIRRDMWGIPSMIVGNFIKC